MKRSSTIAIIATISIAFILGAVAWVRHYQRPFVDREEMERAQARGTRVLEEAEAEVCARAPLRGPARPGSGRDALRALLAPDGVHAECWSWLEPRRDDIRTALSSEAGVDELPEETDPAEEDAVEDPPVAEGWTEISAGRPLGAEPLAIETEMIEACGGVVDALRAAVAHEDVCSPFGPGWVDVPMGNAIHVTLPITALAREAMRGGDLLGGAQIIFDGLRFGTDLGRGPATTIATMIGVAAINTLLGQLEMLLAQDLGWSEEVLTTLQAEVEALVESLPMPDRVLRVDADAMLVSALPAVGWEAPLPVGPSVLPRFDDDPHASEAEARESYVAVMAYIAERLEALSCDASESRERCVARIDELVGGSRALDELEGAPWWSLFLGPRATREHVWEISRRLHLESLPRYPRRMEAGYASLRALWVVLEHRRRVAPEACPSAEAFAAGLEGAIPTEAGLGGRFEIFESHLPYRPLEVSAPSWLHPSPTETERARLPVARLYCPPFPVPMPPTDDEADPAP